jgi:RimJ/RimL family protein N-acetyltransferase
MASDNKPSLIEASLNDVSTIVEFMSDMQDELQEFKLDKTIATKSISDGINNGVHYFLFKIDGVSIGTCHLQEVHCYWRLTKRFYLGGFYIIPTARGKGHFKNIYAALKNWAIDHNGVQIYSHIHKNNDKSLACFSAVDMEDVGYQLMVNHWD